MTFRIASDELGGVTPAAFAEQVDARIATLREYDAHAAIVRAHAADETMKPEDRWVTLAIPQAHPLIDSAIRTTGNPDGTRTFEPDYQIVPPSLDKRKAALFDQVSLAERDAIRAVLAPGKIRAFQFREADIRKADQVRYEDAGEGVLIDFAKYTDEHRPVTDTRFLEEQAAREDQRNEIMRWAANLHSEIEDLTEETIDAFAVRSFHD